MVKSTVSYINRFVSADTIVPDPANPQSFNRYSYAYNNPVIYIDPSGHFTEEAIWNHIYNDLCHGSASCSSDVISQWRSDDEWWAMLLAAEAGDVLFGGFPESCIDAACGNFYLTFKGVGNHTLAGISIPYNGCFFCPTLPGNTNLNDLFKGEYHRSKYRKTYGSSNLSPTYSTYHTDITGFVWGGLLKINGEGNIVDILHRSSVSTAHMIGDNGNSIGGTAAYSLATAAATTGLCSLLATPAAGAACGILGSTATGTLPALSPDIHQELDWVVNSAGHEFTYRSDGGSPLLLPGHLKAATHVYYNGGPFNFHLIVNYVYR